MFCLDHFLIVFLLVNIIFCNTEERPHLLLSSLLLLAVHGPPDDGGGVGLLAGADQADVAPYLGPVRTTDVNTVPGN